MMKNLREIAYRVDPALWVREVLGVTPTAWQETFLRAPRGASILALTARQVGKTSTAAWAIAHSMLFTPGSLSVIGCPAQRQSAEAVRRVKEVLKKVGAKFKSENVYGLELESGSRVLALPSSDDSIRGLTVDAWIVADEAARLPEDLIAALRPMRARRPQARFAMLSTAWSRSDPFWIPWASDDSTWIRLKATADADPTLYAAEFLEDERKALGEHAFNREYLGIPGGNEASPFTWDLYERAIQVHSPLVPPGAAFRPAPKIPIIVHDVGRSNDRSTAVVGGKIPPLFGPQLVSVNECLELPLGLYGSQLANELAKIDQMYDRSCLIVADLSNDPTYAETLFDTFGPRIIGVEIGPSGNGTTFEQRRVKNGFVLVYRVGRTFLLELLLAEFRDHNIRLVPGPESQRAYAQLEALEPEQRERGIVYNCASSQHDDLGISLAMLAWVAQHLHFDRWTRPIFDAHRVPRRPQRFDWRAVT
jgi:hypothetical protein